MPRSMHAWMTSSGTVGNPPVYHFWHVTGRPMRACQFVTAVSLMTGGRLIRSVAPNPPPRPPELVSDSPAGSAPVEIAHEYGGVPPIFPSGSDDVATDRPPAAFSENAAKTPAHPAWPADDEYVAATVCVPAARPVLYDVVAAMS